MWLFSPHMLIAMCPLVLWKTCVFIYYYAAGLEFKIKILCFGFNGSITVGQHEQTSHCSILFYSPLKLLLCYSVSMVLWFRFYGLIELWRKKKQSNHLVPNLTDFTKQTLQNHFFVGARLNKTFSLKGVMKQSSYLKSKIYFHLNVYQRKSQSNSNAMLKVSLFIMFML